MKILVTGGAGFIGTHLIETLLEHEITILDNFSNSSIDEIPNFEQKNIKVIQDDIINLNQIKNSSLFFDLVIHLAAQINVDVSIINPEFNHKVNVIGTKNVLDFCVKNNIQNFIAASSAAIFGEPEKLPLTENSLANPISPYGESKLLMEELIKDYSNKFNLNTIVLRFFNIYGKGQSDEYAGVISKFIKQIRQNEDLVIFGDGNQTRDFLSVGDLTAAINCAIKKINHKRGLCINIGSGKSTTINELATLMISLSKKDLKIKYEIRKKGDIQNSLTSVSYAQKSLNFNPKISLKNGIDKLLEF